MAAERGTSDKTEATRFSQCAHDQRRRLEAEDCDSIRCAQLISGGRRRIHPPYCLAHARPTMCCIRLVRVNTVLTCRTLRVASFPGPRASTRWGAWERGYLACVPRRPSVAGCPGARRGVPVDLARHKGRSRVRVRVRVHCMSYKQRSNIARTARQRRSWLGEWAATKLRLNMTTAPGPGAAGKQQRRYTRLGGYRAMRIYSARQTSHWMSR